ncbi:MMPL family transporter [Mycolicibacterium vanbaalenii]|jgi:RND superfamily putative drug exporter|uniref:MMPL domain protein n=1 Tax=Mycolicibacterium vanbaalenii (strain DSM 7251 / JCM 13017 / BCRC 16820 / KCTC 9966 / NRRL B-24157 / PYR-1) TaxID=350058 RepID=A1T2X1_MYCVP|nr:MMPL family transporter [Mycolicibacterium vanbaalenii]ABM11521.1 MMPL domain protein [Mycolicibacterium vanbaalenii PYR-1]MCV7126691.1 MMPL family transporter [Mycolicibacterium vanbaalenii PYR-1]UJL29552.1 MMPL family transporter [Mycolicibacterium vanbaalenii]WND57410.1 MMPL family transporter [Mycolicibacterium vanbaalenii]
MSRRYSWVVALLVVLLSGALMGLLGGGDSGSQSPLIVPPDAESARADAARAALPDGDQVPAILVVTRADAAPLTPADVAAANSARDRMLTVAGNAAGGPPTQVSEDGQAAVATVPLSADLSGFALTDKVKEVRTAAADGLPGDLRAQVTGGPAFGADIADSFSGANVTLLAVTAAVVALLLIVTYRSPVLWLVPLLVIGFADRVAAVAGAAVAETLGMSPDGSTAGITSVLVFGAGTNYALLLISRYREELGRSESHRDALGTAVRRAGPAIIASNATVVLALLTLLLASSPSTRSLGVQAASGLVIAAVFVLLVLPPALGVFGRKLFWPFIPQVGAKPLTDSGVWHRVAAAVARRPARVAIVSIGGLALLCTGLLGTPVGLSQTEQFRVQAESVSGFETLAAHFPSGLTAPARVIASTDRAAEVQRAITATPGVVSAIPAGSGPGGVSQWSVVLEAAPASDAAFEAVDALRDSVHRVDPDALVGGSDATARDAASAAAHDRAVVIPAILVVVLLVLYLLLRSALAPLVLVGVTVLSALAALGLGGWASVHVFGFPALDYTAPLFAFLFLVALGVDYTIFLVTRAREETPEHGTRDGIVRAVSATGAVITSAGIVLAAVFCVLGVLPLIVLTQVGIIVGLGILLDTFVVRTVIIPALFTLIGPRIWWPALREDGPSRGR